MAKHAHRIILIEKKTWRCTLEGCSWFVHVGLQYVIPGKQLVCWNCGDIFTASQMSLKQDQPTCGCNSLNQPTGELSVSDRNDIIDLQTRLAIRFKTRKLSEIDPAKIRTLIEMGFIDERAVSLLRVFESDLEPVEVPSTVKMENKSYEHRSDCAYLYNGMKCDCKDEVDYE